MAEKELTKEQIARQDEIDNAIQSLLEVLAPENTAIEWDIETIGLIRDAIQEVVCGKLEVMTEMAFYPYIEELRKINICNHCGSENVDHRIYRNLKTRELIEDSEDYFCNACESPCQIISRPSRVCGSCRFAKSFGCPPDSGGDETCGVDCTSPRKIEEYGNHGDTEVNIWRVEPLNLQCDCWDSKDTIDTNPDTTPEAEDPSDDDDEVELIASGYEWVCPGCKFLNKPIEVTETVKCARCGKPYKVANYEHAIG